MQCRRDHDGAAAPKSTRGFAAAALGDALARQKPAWALLVAGSPLATAMAAQPGWRRTYADRWAVVYQRTAP